VRDHVADGRTAFVVPEGDADALRERLAWVLDPANADAVRAVAERGRDEARTRFSAGRYVERLAELVDEQLAR
jgi:glycosyltransferase involved in cell wall biosynthesis